MTLYEESNNNNEKNRPDISRQQRAENMNVRIFTSIFFLLSISACDSTNNQSQTMFPEKLAWENYSHCLNQQAFYKQGEEKQLFVCSVEYKAGMKKHFPEWELGHEYMGIASRDRAFSFDPVYEQIYFQDFSNGSAFLYRKKGEQFFSRYNTLTNTSEITPIEHLESGKVFYGIPRNEKLRKVDRSYSGAFSDQMTTYYVLDENFSILKVIENVDNDLDRKSIFPAVHTNRSTNRVWNNETRMVRHNINGRLFYQVYDTQGNKISPEIPFDEIVYFFQKTHMGIDDSAYDVNPWVDKGDGIYMPIIHFGEDYFFDGTKDYDGFIGFHVAPDDRKKYRGIFVGNQYPKQEKVFKHRSTYLLLQDDIGNYRTKKWYDFHAGQPDVISFIADLKKDPNNFYRDLIYLPFYSGEVSSDGNLVETKIAVYEELDGTYTVAEKQFEKQGLAKLHSENRFTSIEQVQNIVFARQTQLIANAKKAEEKRQEEIAYRSQQESFRAITDNIMQDSRTARNQRQENLKEKVAVLEHNEKNAKPNPFFNLDLKKIMDSEGAKRRASCFKKMSDSKKAYLSGSQGWYYQGSCK